jgi:hypothetical protein
MPAAVVVSNAMATPAPVQAVRISAGRAVAAFPGAMADAPACVKLEENANFVQDFTPAAAASMSEGPALIPAEAEKRPVKRPRKEPAAASTPAVGGSEVGDAAAKVDAAAGTKATSSRGRRGGAKASTAAPAEASASDPAATAAPGAQEPAAVEEGRSGVLVVHKAVRMTLKGLPTPYHVSSDFISALNTRVHELLIDATNRAHANGRKTLRASDL